MTVVRWGPLVSLAALSDHPHTHDESDAHGAGHAHSHPHGPVSVAEARPPTSPSRAVVLDVGERTGALVLTASAKRQGLEVQIHPAADPSAHTHVWVLPRSGARGTTVYAAVFPRLDPGDYAVLEPDGSMSRVLAVPANRVTTASWE